MADRGKRLDDHTQGRIIALRRQSYNIKQIMRRLGLARNTVRKYFYKPVAV